MNNFVGKVAVVTGAASGIGQGLATCFAEEGMRVVLADIEVPALDTATRVLADAGHEILGVPTDVSDQKSVDALAQAALDAYGAIHVVCNNAGVAAVNDWSSLQPGKSIPVWELTLDDWRWTYNVNFWGVLHGIRTFTPILLEQDEPAHIVNTGSVLSFQGGADLVAYGSTKFAVGRVSEALHLQLSKLDTPVRAHLLCPGGVSTHSYLAERNRPLGLSNPEPTPDELELLEHERIQTGESMGTNMPPSVVAAKVIEGLQDERFYIFTHEDSFDVPIRARMERILKREDPLP
jgi:NAD(P)-dependent dehydrogenase (short-subunit alcohol dehydrogenase family)